MTPDFYEGGKSAAVPNKARTFLKQDVVRPEGHDSHILSEGEGKEDQHLLRALCEMGDQLI